MLVFDMDWAYNIFANRGLYIRNTIVAIVYIRIDTNYVCSCHNIFISPFPDAYELIYHSISKLNDVSYVRQIKN
jgi:hypothetical protein